MRAVLNGLYKAGGFAAAFFIFSICAIVMAQVALNLVDRLAGLFFETAIGLTIPSYADFTGFFLAAASFLALAYTLREGGHIRVTLLLQNVPVRVRHLSEIWCLGAAAALTIYFTYYMGLLVLESFEYGDMSSGMVAVPIWIPQSSVLLGLAILSIALIDEFVMVVLGHEASYEGKDENLLDDSTGGIG